MRPYLASVAICLCLFSSCSNSKELSRSKAADLISNNDEFAAVADIKIPIGNMWWDWRNVDSLNQTYSIRFYEKMGALSFQETGKKEGMWTKEYVVQLTDFGKQISRFWTPTKDKLPGVGGATDCWIIVYHRVECGEASGVVYSNVIARKKLDEVTGITAPGDNASGSSANRSVVEFNWEWIISPGADTLAERLPKGVQKGRAELQLYDDGWRVTDIALAN
jgi:hypothetical protein